MADLTADRGRLGQVGGIALGGEPLSNRTVCTDESVRRDPVSLHCFYHAAEQNTMRNHAMALNYNQRDADVLDCFYPKDNDRLLWTNRGRAIHQLDE